VEEVCQEILYLTLHVCIVLVFGVVM